MNHSGRELRTPLLDTIIMYLLWAPHKSNVLDRKLSKTTFRYICRGRRDAGRYCRHQGHAEDYHQPSKPKKENSTRNRVWPTPRYQLGHGNPILSVNSVKIITYRSTLREYRWALSLEEGERAGLVRLSATQIANYKNILNCQYKNFISSVTRN